MYYEKNFLIGKQNLQILKIYEIVISMQIMAFTKCIGQKKTVEEKNNLFSQPFKMMWIQKSYDKHIIVTTLICIYIIIDMLWHVSELL